MTSVILDWLLYGALILSVALLAFLALRVVHTGRSPLLEPWHIHVPDEPRAETIKRMIWADSPAA